MEQGQQVFPHKYIRRFQKDGKWLYVYADDSARTYEQAIKGTTEYKVVLCGGKPTSILIEPNSGMVVTGPPNVTGKKLFINSNPQKPYFAIARDLLDERVPAVYMYPEDYVKTASAKKAAKFELATRAIELLDRDAMTLLRSKNDVSRDAGLVIWLNNNTQMRIGAHAEASSVNPKDRMDIIMQARKNEWSSEQKQSALEHARQPTFGLMTLKMGDFELDRDSMSATFRFVGKGGKDNVYTAPLSGQVFDELAYRKFSRGHNPAAKLFPSKLNYKSIWRRYNRYNVSPHVSRGAFAEAMVKQLMKSYKLEQDDTVRTATHRFNQSLEDMVSRRLNHTRNMTEKAYLTDTVRRAVDAFRTEVIPKMLQERDPMRESAGSNDDNLRALATVLLWPEIGVGNTVI